MASLLLASLGACRERDATKDCNTDGSANVSIFNLRCDDTVPKIPHPDSRSNCLLICTACPMLRGNLHRGVRQLQCWACIPNLSTQKEPSHSCIMLGSCCIFTGTWRHQLVVQRLLTPPSACSVDLVQCAGFEGDVCCLNDDLVQAVQVLAAAMQKWGVLPTLDFVRGGRTGGRWGVAWLRQSA